MISGTDGCWMAIAGCVAVTGICLCSMGPQTTACLASPSASILGGFFFTTFIAAMYECNTAYPPRGYTSQEIRCKTAKVWVNMLTFKVMLV